MPFIPLDQLEPTLSEAPFWLEQILLIALFFFIAWVVYRLAPRMASRIVRLHRVSPKRAGLRPERQETLRGLIASSIAVAGFIIAGVVSLSLFVNTNTLIWVIGLFTAAFGLGGRNLVNDFVSGISLIFADDYAVGEKVQVIDVEGVIEAVNVRTTLLRGPPASYTSCPTAMCA